MGRNRSGLRAWFGGKKRRDPMVSTQEHSGVATYLGNNRVMLRTFVDGQMMLYILPADDLLMTPWFIATGQFENDITRYLVGIRRKDSVFLDVGANFGFYTCLMARLCPNGLSTGIEADERIFNILRDNIAANGLYANGRAVHAAAGAGGEPLTLYRRLTRPGNTSIVFMDQDFTDLMGEDPVEPFTVPCVRVDEVAAGFDRPLDIVKIDVEGAEPLVIEGAHKTIAANPAIKIIMEWAPGSIQCAGFDVSAFVDSLVGLGLNLHTLHNSKPERISADTLKGLDYLSGVLMHRG